MPEFMASSVFLPITDLGVRSETSGKAAVFSTRASIEILKPGAIATPEKAPARSRRMTFVAVPRSTMTAPGPYLWRVPTASATRSLPTSLGWSALIGSPVFKCGPKMSGFDKKTSVQILLQTRAKEGTTDEMIEPVISFTEIWWA
ncbi:MAG: hypothetical protein BWY98_01309 [Tenericutes bacterium ADurb.BinA155]|nr:MAG: hypothetical protein BWY98_01309 [Tenericutes bacterium ADurb.BinA155]